MDRLWADNDERRRTDEPALVVDVAMPQADAGRAVVEAQGTVTADRVVRLVPPLILSADEADQIVQILVPVIRDFLSE